MGKKLLFTAMISGSILLLSSSVIGNTLHDNLSTIVDNTIRPMVTKFKIPGMAVAITLDNKVYFFNYGVMSEKGKRSISNKTLFEIGSVSKTFTASLLSTLALSGKLKLTDTVSSFMPKLMKSALGTVTLVQLATHVSGLPLNPPKQVKTPKKFFQYLRQWKPSYPLGTERVYSNIGIGLLGIMMEQITGESYQTLLLNRILKPLHMDNTYVLVPAKDFSRYAEGYTKYNQPVRIPNKAPLPAAYGIRSCSYDLIKYVQASIRSMNRSSSLLLDKAMRNTHIGYYKTPYFEQALVWEQYPYPVMLKQLVLGNGRNALKTTAKYDRQQVGADTFVNKTGSTDGFSTYVAFISSKNIGIVLLANKYYPNEARVRAGYAILTKLIRW